jgi:1-acyl-sn-glycerol-3-phosphate acyltransferase
MSSQPNLHNPQDHESSIEEEHTQTHESLALSSHSIPFTSHMNEFSFTERCAIRLLGWMNRPGWGRRLGMFWSHVPKRTVQLLSEHRWRLRGVEHLAEIKSDVPLLLVSNHRTFFDLFIGMTALRTATQNRLGNPCSFPVRSPFFYDHPLGMLINVIAAGGSMYPPVFRDERKTRLNQEGIIAMRYLLRQPGLCFGLHPEGHRSKLEDPFQLASLKRGVGQLISEADPSMMVLPMFMSGLTNHLTGELHQAVKRRNARPIYIRWGTPLPVSSYRGDELQVVSAIQDQMQRLGDLQREELAVTK